MLRGGKVNGVIMVNESFMMKGVSLVGFQMRVVICTGIKRVLFINQYIIRHIHK